MGLGQILSSLISIEGGSKYEQILFHENPNYHPFIINKILTNEKTQNNCFIIPCNAVIYQNKV